MTAKLEIRVEINDSRAAGGGVVATLWPLDGGEPRRARLVLGRQTPVEVEEGRWLIEVVLPSGERLRATVQAAGTVDVSMSPEPSPHEWLAHHSLLVPRRRMQPAVGLIAPDTTPVPRVHLREEWPEDWTRGGLVAAVDKGELEVDPQDEIFAAQHDGRLYLFEIGGARAPQLRLGSAVVEIGDRTVVLPVARGWETLGGRRATTRIVVNAGARTVSTSVDDAEFGPVMTYLARSRRDDAATSLGDLPLDLLLDKLQNPFAAAAGAYVLVDDLERSSDPPRWRSWISNLARWFPHLPDGAILEGRALQQTGKPETALDWFLKAFDEGMPLFGEGVRLLLEGLLSFEPDTPGDRLDRATRSVRRWASWLDSREPFATLGLPLEVKVSAVGEGSEPMTATA